MLKSDAPSKIQFSVVIPDHMSFNVRASKGGCWLGEAHDSDDDQELTAQRSISLVIVVEIAINLTATFCQPHRFRWSGRHISSHTDRPSAVNHVLEPHF